MEIYYLSDDKIQDIYTEKNIYYNSRVQEWIMSKNVILIGGFFEGAIFIATSGLVASGLYFSTKQFFSQILSEGVIFMVAFKMADSSESLLTSGANWHLVSNTSCCTESFRIPKVPSLTFLREKLESW